jgi:modulator of drug activity B
MKKVLIINAHQYYPFSEGKLNQALIDKMDTLLKSKGYEVKHSNVMHEYNPASEVEKHLWADAVIMQSPVNWMGLPWMAKKYIDEVYSTGMMGQLCSGDGRTTEAPKKNYGGGGLLQNTKYMLSLTFNAPSEAFNDPSEYLFQGKSVDDLWLPQHMNFRFFGMKPLATFVCFDVMKNPTIEADFKRLEEHLNKIF